VISQLLLVGLGGAAGSILRFLFQRWLNPPVLTAFPTGTFIVNVAGCLVIGIVWAITAKNMEQAGNARLLIMTGLLGGFTTFSAFSLESIHLLRNGKPGLFFVYVTASIVLCLLATFIGIKMIRI